MSFMKLEEKSLYSLDQLEELIELQAGHVGTNCISFDHFCRIHCFPTAVFVGGQAEVAYYAQSAALLSRVLT